MVASFYILEMSRYKIHCVECKFDELYIMQHFPLEWKRQRLHQVLSNEYEKIGSRNPPCLVLECIKV